MHFELAIPEFADQCSGVAVVERATLVAEDGLRDHLADRTVHQLVAGFPDLAVIHVQKVNALRAYFLSGHDAPFRP